MPSASGDRSGDAACAEARRRLEAREAALIARLDAAPDGELSPAAVRAFRRLVRDHHAACGRHDLPWRHTRDPWGVLVSEVMLQQTQVSRVLTAWPRFLERFPAPHVLADAPLADVLEQWRGMGYNRRALALKRSAEEIVERHGGEVPRTLAGLDALPGIGTATASAVLASAFGIAEPYVETNIRAVFLHVFFRDAADVPDRDILPFVSRTLDRKDPRTWYFALMDYGNWLKRREVNPCRRSRHHAVQQAFGGSTREARGAVLRTLVSHATPLTAEETAAAAGLGLARTERALSGLARDGFVREEDGRYGVAE